MSDERDNSGLRRASGRILPFPRPTRRAHPGERPPRPRVRKLRLALLLAGLAALALVSTVFGMMMAVASDLPKIEDRQRFRDAASSLLLDVRGEPLGVLTDNRNIVLVHEGQIAPAMENAIIAIEDKRFRSEPGVDVRGIARAAVSDVFGSGPTQGASTITQQFVKNALSAQRNRTVFEKLREASIAYHLSRKWSKEKILTEYLNSIYFGNGAYGIESAARTYFGRAHPGCGRELRLNDPCAAQLRPAEAAMLAGVVASPAAYDPIAHPQAARARRDLVLRRMLEQRLIPRAEYETDRLQAVPVQADLTPPEERTQAPYFTSWVRQQVFRSFGPTAPFKGLRIYTTLDLDLQRAAEQAISSELPAGAGLPAASLVAIDNRTGEVRAMVGGSDYRHSPFNLATQGQRQPGSSFKPFTLVTALERGISPSSVWASKRKVFTVPNSRGKERFVVNNFEGAYSGSNTLAGAMTVSDNSIYAEVGIDVGVGRVARTARAMGIRTPVSHNYAMTLGGLRQGVTPLDMAHAYETLATGGSLVTSGSGFGSARDGPVGIHEVKQGGLTARNVPRWRRVIPPGVAANVSSILETVVTSGTGKAAALPGFAAGKTGTTENYGDAWFVGWNDRFTVAVWVGYPNALRSMKTLYRGGPVEGGTYPAVIWHAFMTAAKSIVDQRRPARDGSRPSSTDAAPGDTSAPSTSPSGAPSSTPAPGTTPAATAPTRTAPRAPATSKAAPAPARTGPRPARRTPAPTRTPPAPTPQTPAPTPGGGSGGAGGAGAPSTR